MPHFYRRKLYALLDNTDLCNPLNCWGGEREEIAKWWEQHKSLIEEIASSSDRVNLDFDSTSETVTIKHPISGQERSIHLRGETAIDFAPIANEKDAKKVFWWFWRFYPALRAAQQPDTLLEPQHAILPDCPTHSYRATVSALAGTCYPQTETFEYPYLLLFTFSPVQEFIKASRKFLDFWAGSYLLHYLSAKLCWRIADRYGPDAIVTPSLWGQEIIDALLLQQYSDFEAAFEAIGADGKTPKTRFEKKTSISLATAGFPNTISVLVPNSEKETLGKNLSRWLTEEWQEIAKKVREGNPDSRIEKLKLGIRERTIDFLEDERNRDTIEALLEELGGDTEANRRDLERWQNLDCWQWRSLWHAQIDHTWQPYWVAVPFGDPDTDLQIEEAEQDYSFDGKWIASQEAVAQTRAPHPPPTEAEKTIYQTLNVGTWWGSIQARLGQAVQAVKNTRVWQIPTAPGYRSTLSGQFSALHPGMKYCHHFREGRGLPAESMRLFWRLMAEVYPGLFNGSEQLNALEMTKRMAWVYGGVAESLGIELGLEGKPDEALEDELDYNQLIRFPNLSSIAAARFAYRDCIEQSGKLRGYWKKLNCSIKKKEEDEKKQRSEKEKRGEKYIPSQLRQNRFAARTRRPFQIPKTDRAINAQGQSGQDYNGVMFASKWLADDMGLDRKDTNILRGLVDEAHKEAQFGEGSPADWWAIVLGDGDGMGQYVSGQKLHPYEKYLSETDARQLIERSRLSEAERDRRRDEFIAQFGHVGEDNSSTLLKTRKRMGPATHVGLNRALLDFSNRLVPYLTQQRFCGRVIYSGGDDVMAVLPLEDLPEYLLSVQAAWCGGRDPYRDPEVTFAHGDGYWQPSARQDDFCGLPNRPLFTMGKGATMSFGIVIAHKSVPLPTVLKALWEAESDRAKKMLGSLPNCPDKNGLCFRVLYGSGNQLEALLKGELLAGWWQWLNLPDPEKNRQDLSSLLYRLAEELPRHAALTEGYRLVAKAAGAIAQRRDGKEKIESTTGQLCQWLQRWEYWANAAQNRAATLNAKPLGATIPDLAYLLRFSAFWLDKMGRSDG